MPCCVDGARTVFESSIIIEYLDLHHPGPARLIPGDADAALDVRMMDRFFDNYISHADAEDRVRPLRPEADRDRYGVAEARAMLDTAYAWLDQRMAGRAMGRRRRLQPCRLRRRAGAVLCRLGAPDSGIARPPEAYRQRLLARPSFARAVDEARPYRSYFPLGAPDRD